MVGKYKEVTLCGSTRFRDAFMETQKRLTLEGNIVISVGLFGHSGDGEVRAPGVKEMLDDMHKRKIDMADEIFVINKGGYIAKAPGRKLSTRGRPGRRSAIWKRTQRTARRKKKNDSQAYCFYRTGAGRGLPLAGAACCRAVRLHRLVPE